MSEKQLVELGAECVCGDLILDRKTVGRYRNGQFIITEDGLDRLNNVIDVEAVVVRPKVAKAAKKGLSVEPVEDVVPKSDEPVDPAE